MFSNLSYNNKLLLKILPILLIGLLSLSGGAHWYINSLIKEDLTASMLATTGKTAESINAWFKALMLEPESVAATPAAKAINSDFSLIDRQNIGRFKMLREKYPDVFEDIYAANSKGEYHTVQQKGGDYTFFVGDISNRNYFRSIMSGGGTQISQPLISKTTGKPTIFIAAPIKDDENRPQGLIGAGITLKYVEQLASQLKTGQSGYGIIVSSNGTIIHHPDKEIAMLKNTDELGDESIKELGRRMKSGASGIFGYTYKGQKKIAFYKPIPVAGWSVATVIPEAELFEPATRMLISLAIITVVVLILAGIAIYMSARSLTRPLKDLAKQAKEIASGNLNVTALEVSSQDEVGQLASQFNIMSANLSRIVQELELKNRSLEQEIKERGQAQVALAASEEKFSKAFSHVSDFLGIIRLRDQVYIDVNDACFNILGFKREEIVGHTSDEFDLWQDKEVREKAYSQVKTQGSFHNFETYMRTKSGELRFGLISAEVVEIGGEPCVIYAWRDITDRKKAQDDLRDAQEELVRKEKLAVLGQLSGSVSHELRNPLGVMSNAIFLLKMTQAKADQTTREYLDIIAKEIDNSTRIITDLLDFARTKTPHVKMVSVDALIDMSSKKCTIPENVKFQKDVPQGLPMLKVDPQQMEQVLINLLTNGIQAMPEGGSLCIAARREGDALSISIRDSGLGITPENMKKLFQPLFTTKPRGIGLGLVVCKNIVDANSGTIKVESEPGRGTTFTVVLPTEQNPKEVAVNV